MENSLEVSSLECNCRSAEPYANYMRKRTRKRRCKQVAFIARQLKKLKDVRAQFNARKSAAIASAEVPSVVVQQYLEKEVFMESLINVELVQVLHRLESQLKFGLAVRDMQLPRG